MRTFDGKSEFVRADGLEPGDRVREEGAFRELLAIESAGQLVRLVYTDGFGVECPPATRVMRRLPAIPVEELRAALKAGKRVKVTVGPSPDDPVGILTLDEGMVMWESVAGWSAGVVEPACSIESDYLKRYLRHDLIEVL